MYIDTSPSRLSKKIFNALIQHRLGLINMQNQRRGNILATGINPAHKGLDHGNNDLTCRIGSPFGEQGAKLHHQDDALPLFQTFDKAIFVCLANDLADISGSKLGKGHPERTGHLGVIISWSTYDFLHVPGKLLCIRGIDIVDFLF